MKLVNVMIARIICIGVMLLGGILCLFLQSSMVAMMICLAIVLAAAITMCIISLLFWHCRSCGRGLPGRSLIIDFCPYCGKPLDDE